MSKPFDFKPDTPAVVPTTADELNAWMRVNGCNFLSYQIETGSIAEGFILSRTDAGFEWKFTERGKERVISSFAQEAEAVAHAYRQIKSDGWAWSHMIAFLKSRTKLRLVKWILRRRGISFEETKIPYGGPHDPRFAVYVHGRDAEAVADLRRWFGGGPRRTG